MKSNIALAGFMGTGKSTVGAILAKRMEWIFVDTDTIIEAETGRSIVEIFAESGEPAFRQLEAAICQRFAGRARHVVALGGGSLLDAQTRSAFNTNSLVICLTATLEEIIRRIDGNLTRPLYSNSKAVSALMATRAEHYASHPFHIETTGRTPEDVAEEIVTLWNQNG